MENQEKYIGPPGEQCCDCDNYAPISDEAGYCFARAPGWQFLKENAGSHIMFAPQMRPDWYCILDFRATAV